MDMPYINIKERDLGFSEDGEKLTMLGQIYGYEDYNDITVLNVEKNGQVDLVFMEANGMLNNNLNQISNKEVIFELKELWPTTKVAEHFEYMKK